MDDLLAGAEVASTHVCPIRPVINRSLSSLKFDGRLQVLGILRKNSFQPTLSEAAPIHGALQPLLDGFEHMDRG